MIGQFPVGEQQVGHVATFAPITTFTDVLRTRKNELVIPSPLLEFWDVATPVGTQRFVDFADPDAQGSTPTTVPFDGNEYTSAKLSRTEDRSSTDGAVHTLTLSIADPFHTVVKFLRDHDGLTNQLVTRRLISYDRIGFPAEAVKATYRIRGASASQSPDRVSVVLGMPNLFEMRFPRLVTVRDRCPHEYPRRFEIGNRCTAGTDEFEAGTKQFFRFSGTAEKKLKHGWFVANQANADTVWNSDSLISGSLDRALECETFVSDVRWLNATRNGPYAYKKVTGDFDVYCKLNDLISARAEFLFGLLVQSIADPSDWIFWGWHEDTGVIEFVRRETTNDVSTDTKEDKTVFHFAFRVKRTGDNFELLSTVADPTLQESAHLSNWLSQATVTHTLGSQVRVGLVVASDSTATSSLRAAFFYFRFLSRAEFPKCKRDLVDCEARGNLYQFGGFIGIPDGRR